MKLDKENTNYHFPWSNELHFTKKKSNIYRSLIKISNSNFLLKVTTDPAHLYTPQIQMRYGWKLANHHSTSKPQPTISSFSIYPSPFTLRDKIRRLSSKSLNLKVVTRCGFPVLFVVVYTIYTPPPHTQVLPQSHEVPLLPPAVVAVECWQHCHPPLPPSGRQSPRLPPRSSRKIPSL